MSKSKISKFEISVIAMFLFLIVYLFVYSPIKCKQQQNLPLLAQEHCTYMLEYKNNTAMDFFFSMLSDDCLNIVNNCNTLHGQLEVNEKYKKDYPNITRVYRIVSGNNLEVVACNVKVKRGGVSGGGNKYTD